MLPFFPYPLTTPSLPPLYPLSTPPSHTAVYKILPLLTHPLTSPSRDPLPHSFPFLHPLEKLLPRANALRVRPPGSAILENVSRGGKSSTGKTQTDTNKVQGLTLILFTTLTLSP